MDFDPNEFDFYRGYRRKKSERQKDLIIGVFLLLGACVVGLYAISMNGLLDAQIENVGTGIYVQKNQGN